MEYLRRFWRCITGNHDDDSTHRNPDRIIIPEHVENISVSSEPKQPSVTLQWSRPANCSAKDDVIYYHIRYKEKCTNNYTELSPVPSDTLMIVFTCGGTDKYSSLKPLTSYVFEVRAEGQDDQFGQWSEVECYISWVCLYPLCTQDRIKVVLNPDNKEPVVYGYCSLDHKKECDSRYCVYPECTKPKLCLSSDGRLPPLHMYFCGDKHYTKALNEGKAFLVYLDPCTSKEYQYVQKKFVKKWNSKKGPCPTIRTILAIINPAVEEKLQQYIETQLPQKHRKVKMYFHGTKLTCLITEHQMLCNGTSCGVCGIARRGFVSSHIVRDKFQRFGQAFYFAPNSSKSHDYCGQPFRDSSSDRYWGMFLCKIAPGRKYTLRPRHESQPVPTEPPDGYHSLYGKRKKFFLSSDLNYDELAVFNEDAISPRYLIMYS